MRWRTRSLPLLGMALTMGCDASTVASPAPSSLSIAAHVAAAQLPGDGNGRKEIVEIFVQNPVNCGGGVVVTRTVEGWIQIIDAGGDASGAAEVSVYRIDYTFTNAAGETFVVRETGIDRLYIEDGFLMIHIAGKTPVHSGTITINLDTGEVTFEAGQEYDLPRDRACAALA